MDQTLRGNMHGAVVFGGALAVLALTGCLPGRQAAQVAPVALTPGDKGACEGWLIKSIWKGEDTGGASCSQFLTSDGRAPELSGDGVQTVCERTHIRAILTGEAATSFTQRACVDYVRAYPEARIRKTCRSVARGPEPDLTDVQRSLCMAHVGPLPAGEPRRPERSGWALASNAVGDAPSSERSAAPQGRVWQEGSGGTRWWTSANIASQPALAGAVLEPVAAPAAVEPSPQPAVEPEVAGAPEPAPVVVAAPVAVAPPTPVAPVAPVAVAPAAVAPVGAAAPAAVAPVAAAAVAAPAGTPAPPSAASIPAVSDAPASRVRCEDSYIESIWKGRDSSGPECAAYVAYDGSTPDYNAGRIASVCLGAETRALRSNLPMTTFTLQACLKVLRGRWSPDAAEPARATTGADWNTDPADTSIRRGLSDAAISSTVDASWRSIERDCASVAPLSGTSEPATKTPVVVTMTVGSSGRVRSASARAAGNRELELCIESSVRAWSFPQAVGNTVISVPLSFEARR